MKFILTTCLVFTFLTSFGQQPKVNNINQVKTLNIYGSNNKTTIGKLIINQKLESKLFLTQTLQTKDSSGIYRTEFLFKNPEGVPTFGVKMDFHFDKPCDTAYSTFDGVIMGHLWGFVGNKNNFRITVDQLFPNAAVRLIVFSKGVVQTEIEGVKGITKN